jgi:D-aminopeptidase
MTEQRNRLRARDLGIPFIGKPGPWNAITDVAGVEVGYTTIIRGTPELGSADRAVRTGVTVIFARGVADNDPVFAGLFTLNGAGEMTGTHWVNESGFLESPIALTNTHSIGAVHEAIIKWQLENQFLTLPFSMPVISETYDGRLSDTNGFHVREEHVRTAISDARSGPILEGNVGGGTGMSLFGWKGGTGTASRVCEIHAGSFTVGALVQANFGRRHELIIAGIPVGSVEPDEAVSGRGSVVIIVATDAPLLPHQLGRMAKRAALGVARVGGSASNTSGDFILAFSTANRNLAAVKDGTFQCDVLPNAALDELFEATVATTEEAIINALVAAETMVGLDGNVVRAFPHDRLVASLRACNRIV